MSKNINTLVEDIYNLFDGDAVELTAEVSRLVQEMGDDIVADTRRALSERRDSRHKSNLRLSSIGKPERQLWFNCKEEYDPIPMPADVLYKMNLGNITESQLLALAQIAGHKVEYSQHEVEVNGVKGHIDAIIDGVLVDVKTASQWAFKNKFVEGGIFKEHGDGFGYLGQLSAYKTAMDKELSADLDCKFVVLNKSDAKIAVIDVPREHLIDAEARIDTHRSNLESDTPPAAMCYPTTVDKSGNVQLNIQCGFCDYRKHCFAGENGKPKYKTFQYANGMKIRLLEINKKPRIAEVED